ncbi:FHA domain-containing protein [Paraflavisolibacter sp. H34]|uniref:FHA domain-containing protein n=1 Tax=Huijunlia imazamoxiresistens TaxID=3127457 RepID=UPI0030174A55
MFGFFKKDKDKENEPVALDVKLIRERLLQFIKEQLQKVEGGEGRNIKGLHLFIACSEAEKHMYEAAVYAEEEHRFQQEEVQKIADDFALDLPEGWILDIRFDDSLPPEAVKVPTLDAALFVETRKRALRKSATAYIRILNGEAEQESYTLTSEGGRVNIGREKKVQTGDGFFRLNAIAFPADSRHESNKFISRQHAHIEWDNDSGAFLLFADEGGIPPRNKIKVRTADGTLVKLQAMEVGHQLQEGDQIILGDSAALEFSFRES